MRPPLLLIISCFLLLAPMGLAGPNALCVIMETNYYNCIRHNRRRQREKWAGATISWRGGLQRLAGAVESRPLFLRSVKL
jgi:hypothetical protein